jgi:hypothetical protein
LNDFSAYAMLFAASSVWETAVSLYQSGGEATQHDTRTKSQTTEGAGKDASGWKSCHGWAYWRFCHPDTGAWHTIQELRGK